MGGTAIFVNRACTGSFNVDLTNPRVLKTRFTRKVNGLCNATRAVFAPEEYYVERNPSRTSLCANVLQSQYLGVTKKTDVVLLTSGGNDLRFGQVLFDCLVPLTRSIPKCQAALNNVYANLDTFGTSLTDALLSIKPRLHDTAVIVVVPYPYLVLNTPETYNPIFKPGKLEITNNLRNLGDAADQRQRLAVAAANRNSTRKLPSFTMVPSRSLRVTNPTQSSYVSIPIVGSMNWFRWVATLPKCFT
jgi:hypothetical protein